MEVCRANDIGLVASNDIKMPNCTNTSWTVDNIIAKDKRIALTRVHTRNTLLLLTVVLLRALRFLSTITPPPPVKGVKRILAMPLKG